jgi:hypothetical protein
MFSAMSIVCEPPGNASTPGVRLFRIVVVGENYFVADGRAGDALGFVEHFREKRILRHYRNDDKQHVGYGLRFHGVASHDSTNESSCS